ncbi:hypothetical protein QE152_g8067 [Popillia japonica]|uniref:Uncharacterized protein n=1 Tax=Popillia japonica TaxID=7064 RepID=A0AAW1MCQ9_POPJA
MQVTSKCPLLHLRKKLCDENLEHYKPNYKNLRDSYNKSKQTKSLPDGEVELFEYDTNSEQNVSEREDNEDFFPLEQTTRVPYLFRKDGTKWSKHPMKKRNVQSCVANVQWALL